MTPAEIAAFDAATDKIAKSFTFRGTAKGEWRTEGDFMLRHCGGHDLGSKLMNERNALLRETPAEIVRFMQDQPLAFRESEYNCRATLPWKISHHVRGCDRMSSAQERCCRTAMARRKWIEPPRFDAFAVAAVENLIVYICPGRVPSDDAVLAFNEQAKAASLPMLWTIGGLAEKTTDPSDPRLLTGKKATYVTPLMRMLARAEAAGALVTEPSDTSSVST